MRQYTNFLDRWITTLSDFVNSCMQSSFLVNANAFNPSRQVFGTPRNISVPATAFSNGRGSYSLQIPLKKDDEMLITMSDATGFNTGGTTTVLTVQASKGGKCDTTDPGIGFPFQLNTALQQCRPFVFSGYNSATQPVTITGIIPGGNSFILNPPVGPTSFSWTANVARGTSLIFFMTDARGRQGGSSDVRIVSTSDDASCLSGSSPVTTTGAPSVSLTSTKSSPTGPSTTSTASSTPTPSPQAGGVSIAAIAGTVIGSLLFLAVIVTLGLFFLRRKRDAAWQGSQSNIRRQSHRTEIDFEHGPSGYNMPHNATAPPSQYPYSPNSSRPYDSNPFLDSPLPTSQYAESRYQDSQADLQSQYGGTHGAPYSESVFSYQNSQQAPSQLYPPRPNYPPAGYPPIRLDPPVDPFNPTGPPMVPESDDGTTNLPYASNSAPPPASTSGGASTAAARKAAMAGTSTYVPSRFIVHTDAEDDLPPPNEDGVVELPPQYMNDSDCGQLPPTNDFLGGSPPFRLLIISVRASYYIHNSPLSFYNQPLQPIRNISIPDSAFNSDTKEGSFTTQLLFAVHNRVMFTISDATGIAAGGLTKLLTVADSKNLGCNTTSPGTNPVIRTITRSDYNLIMFSIQYFVPGGEYFQITAPIGDTFSWRNNLTAGTEVIFGVKDAQGRDGGTSGSKVVITSNDTSCLTRKKGVSASNTAAIIGGAVGGIVGLLLIAILLWFFLRRRRRARRALEKGKFDITYDPIGGTLTEDNALIPHPYIIEPLPVPVGPSENSFSSKSRLTVQTSSQQLVATSPRYSEFSHTTGNSSMYTDPRASVTPSQRVIVHTDISETEGPVELPPQYSDRRAPIPGLPSNMEQSSSTASSSEPTSPRPRKS
ncbi:hypothetical protein CVT24_000523 [Panaeolus cyanescens]|uniref:Mid2 domain-containing protein n=1 Tax=Panaeolus cyanescens TaxID=181874 RepID=A0A409VAI2_9AGAR|nr:hypothetical protein CVT24_000523 [Panaeolus cyanescens]